MMTKTTTMNTTMKTTTKKTTAMMTTAMKTTVMKTTVMTVMKLTLMTVENGADRNYIQERNSLSLNRKWVNKAIIIEPAEKGSKDPVGVTVNNHIADPSIKSKFIDG